MIQLNGTTACLMRDELWKRKINKEITFSEITDRLSKQDVPKWLQAQIIEMWEFRKLDRCKCPVEDAMHQAVCNIIVRELMEEEKNDTCIQ